MKMNNDNLVDLLDSPDPLRDAVRVTEVTGVRTVFTREGRSVAILLSWDEYVALAETVRLAGDAARLAAIREADEELSRSGGTPLDESDAHGTVRLATRASGALEGLSGADRESSTRALERIAENPIAGAPLFDPLRGFWVVRAGGIRLVYRVSRDGSMAGVVLIDRAEETS